MRLLIDKGDLELLLEKKRDYIGKKVTFDTVVAGISFMLSVVTASYTRIWIIPGIVLKTVFCIVGLAYMLKICYDIATIKKNKYNHKNLMKDIEDLDMIQHNHSLILIKNKAKGRTAEYLTYYDERWDCKLFPNIKTADINNETVIINKICRDLGIAKRDVKCKYISSRVQEKFSVSHNENRVYNHKLYEVQIENFPEKMKQEDFSVGSLHYYWMTINDMEKDENIIEKNLDVVDFVKECDKDI